MSINKNPYTAGLKQVLRSIESGEAIQVIIAEDADDFIKNKVITACTDAGIEYSFNPCMKQLGELCGIHVGSSVAYKRKD